MLLNHCVIIKVVREKIFSHRHCVSNFPSSHYDFRTYLYSAVHLLALQAREREDEDRAVERGGAAIEVAWMDRNKSTPFLYE